ncbi:hypothetical protein [Adhaeribacter terreus]|uniref:Uncharacterized protein n=1 Tax=Adhaeribacter terreus TaxID=529703 RepID=A0ABW0E7V7_9BACT
MQKLIAGILLFLFPLYAFCLWIFVFNKYPNHQERNAHFADFMIFSDNPVLVPLLSIILSVASAILLGSLTIDNLLLRVLVYAIILANCFLIALNIYGLM